MNLKPKIIVRRIIAVLLLPKKLMQIILKGKTMVQSITGNANFPTPVPALAVVTTDIAALDTAEIAAQTRAKGTADVRNAKLQIVCKDLRALTAYVQSIADANPANAEAIILSAGLDVKKAGAHNHPDFEVKNTKVSGNVVLTALGGGAHEWQMSNDQTNWVYIPTTLGAKTKVNGLKAGTTVYFRCRKISRDGLGSWSQTIYFVVT